MQYMTLGNTGLVISRLTFGAMTFGSVDGNRVAKVDRDGASILVDKAIDSGINFFDTADGYTDGQSETILGDVLGTRRKDVIISTKVGFRYSDPLINSGLSRRYIMQATENSLKRLNTDYIDVYMVHRIDPFTPIEETLEALNDLVRQGKVRYVGFSNWPAWKAAKAVGLQEQHGWAKFITAQVYYSLLGRDLENEIVPFVQDAGIGTMIWSPLVAGFLTGKYTRENPSGTDGSRMRNPSDSWIPFDVEHGFNVIDELQIIAKSHHATLAQISLAWLLTKEHVNTIIVGASKLKQLEENIRAINICLTQGEIQHLNKLTTPTEVYPNWFARKADDTRLTDALTGDRAEA